MRAGWRSAACQRREDRNFVPIHEESIQSIWQVQMMSPVNQYDHPVVDSPCFSSIERILQLVFIGQSDQQLPQSYFVFIAQIQELLPDRSLVSKIPFDFDFHLVAQFDPTTRDVCAQENVQHLSVRYTPSFPRNSFKRALYWASSSGNISSGN